MLTSRSTLTRGANAGWRMADTLAWATAHRLDLLLLLLLNLHDLNVWLFRLHALVHGNVALLLQRLLLLLLLLWLRLIVDSRGCRTRGTTR